MRAVERPVVQSCRAQGATVADPRVRIRQAKGSSDWFSQAIRTISRKWCGFRRPTPKGRREARSGRRDVTPEFYGPDVQAAPEGTPRPAGAP